MLAFELNTIVILAFACSCYDFSIKNISRKFPSSISKPSKTGQEKREENKFGDYIGKEPLPVPDLSKLNINVQPKDLLQIGRISAMVDEFGSII